MTKRATHEAVAYLEARFTREADPARAVSAKAYMKSALRFHGVSSAQVRAAAKDFVAERPALTCESLRAIAEAAFETDAFDVRSGAIAILERKRKLLVEADLPWLVELVREASCWAHVDWIAT